MNTPSFLINDYIKDLSVENIKAELYKKNIMTKDYPEDGLMLVYHKYDEKPCSQMERECRSLVLDRETKKIVSYSCMTPMLNNEAEKFMKENSAVPHTLNKCYEGTLLSVFYHNKWYVSTRRCLNSNMSLWGENMTSHYTMFEDVLVCSGYKNFEDFTEKLNKNLCYNFILIHHMNKNDVDYVRNFGLEYKKLCLASIRNKETQSELEYNNTDYNFLSDNIFMSETYNSMDEFSKIYDSMFSFQPSVEGVIVKMLNPKTNNYDLLKLQTRNYKFVKSMGATKNIYAGLIYLFQNNCLKKYLDENPNYMRVVNPYNISESYDVIGLVDALFKVVTSELYELFQQCFDLKTGKSNNNSNYNLLPKEYKQVLYGLRGIYFSIKADNFKNKDSAIPKNYFKINDIYMFIKEYPTENLCMLLQERRLLLNSARVDQTYAFFNSTSVKCSKIHLKLVAIYLNKLFPNVSPSDVIVV